MSDRLRAFFASPYRDQYRWIRHAAATAARTANIDFRSLDELVTPGANIINTLHEEIDSCDFAIALLTALNPNVLYEVGRLLQASKPTILIADGDTLKNLPFDFRSFAFVTYDAHKQDEAALVNVLSKSFAQVREAIDPATRAKFRAAASHASLVHSASIQQVSSVQTIDFEDIRKEAERRLGKNGCRTTDIIEFDSDSFKGWNQTIECPCGDDVLIVIDLNGDIKRTKIK